MTLKEIEQIDKEMLIPADVATFLGCGTHNINCACKAGTLPWAYMVGTRCKIPKEAFVHYHRYGAALNEMRIT